MLRAADTCAPGSDQVYSCAHELRYCHGMYGGCIRVQSRLQPRPVRVAMVQVAYS